MPCISNNIELNIVLKKLSSNTKAHNADKTRRVPCKQIIIINKASLDIIINLKEQSWIQSNNIEPFTDHISINLEPKIPKTKQQKKNHKIGIK